MALHERLGCGVVAAAERRAGCAAGPSATSALSGFDLLFVFVFYIVSSIAMFAVIAQVLGPDADKPAAGADVETSHAIVQLFRGGNPWMILLCVVSAVVVAPIVEEFLFRVLLQGWLERVARRLRPMLRPPASVWAMPAF